MKPDGDDLGARAYRRACDLGVPPYSERPDRLVRRFLTDAHRVALDQLSEWMSDAGMSVRIDSAGNLIGRYEGAVVGAPALLMGSHIDTVDDAGCFDGALGVLLAIDCVEALHAARRRFRFAVEVIAFGDEEGSRFPASMVCSHAVAGIVKPDSLALRDADGIALEDALATFHRRPCGLAEARRAPGDFVGYLEAHIEQGPLLEAEGLAVGVVSAIAAQRRMKLRFGGVQGHAGTTPMHLRADPTLAAAEAILAVERICRQSGDGVVGTVGHLESVPGAFNVIPGLVEIWVDVRAPTLARCHAVLGQILGELQLIVDGRGLSMTTETVQELAETVCDPLLVGVLEDAIRGRGLAPRRLISGAGHDGMAIAHLAPVAMLFIRCGGGVSHSARETVAPCDSQAAARVMLGFVAELDRRLARQEAFA